MVQMPPGSTKSTYVSILFPAYFLSRNKTGQIIATSHTASLADYFGRHVRNAIAEHGDLLGLQITKESRAAARFSLEGGGEYFAAGVRGPITGRRADLIIIDDPVKSWAEAESQTFRDALYDWYRAELSARLKPGGPVVLMMTRWHEDDLAGRLLAESTWSCLRLPAIFRQFPGRHSWNTAVLSLQQAKAGSQHLRGTPRLPCSHETGDIGGPVRESVTHSRRFLGHS
jgi:hypothetical protein